MTSAQEPPVVYFDIIHDIQSLECRWHNTLTGTLALQLGGTVFPDPDWNDFMVRTLTSWIISARLVLAHRARETFPFMDGPPEFTAFQKSSTEVEIICYEGHGFRGNAPSVLVDALQFGTTLHLTARKVENWARRNHCESKNIHFLTDGIHSLGDVVTKMKQSRDD